MAWKFSVVLKRWPLVANRSRKVGTFQIPDMSGFCFLNEIFFCFVWSLGLHLLAQTDLYDRLSVKSHHSNCPSPSCLLSHFLHEYASSKKRIISDRPLVDHFNKVFKISFVTWRIQILLTFKSQSLLVVGGGVLFLRTQPNCYVKYKRFSLICLYVLACFYKICEVFKPITFMLNLQSWYL